MMMIDVIDFYQLFDLMLNHKMKEFEHQVQSLQDELEQSMQIKLVISYF